MRPMTACQTYRPRRPEVAKRRPERGHGRRCRHCQRGYRCAADLPACRPKNVASATPARALEDNDVGPGPLFALYGAMF